MSSSANVAPEDPSELGEIALQHGRRVRVGVLEQQRDVCVGLRLRLGDAGAHDVGGFLLDRRVEVVAEDSLSTQVALIAAEAFVSLLLLDALEIRSEEHTSELQSHHDL